MNIVGFRKDISPSAEENKLQNNKSLPCQYYRDSKARVAQISDRWDGIDRESAELQRASAAKTWTVTPGTPIAAQSPQEKLHKEAQNCELNMLWQVREQFHWRLQCLKSAWEK